MYTEYWVGLKIIDIYEWIQKICGISCIDLKEQLQNYSKILNILVKEMKYVLKIHIFTYRKYLKIGIFRFFHAHFYVCHKGIFTKEMVTKIRISYALRYVFQT